VIGKPANAMVSRILAGVALVALVALPAAGLALSRSSGPPRTAAASASIAPSQITPAQRAAAAARLAAKRNAVGKLAGPRLQSTLRGLAVVPTLTPNATPDYFGTTPNFANSPLPDLDTSGNPIFGTGIRKFVDSLPGLGPQNANDLGQYIPVAVPDTTTYPGSDYYIIALVRYTKKLHADLPATRLQGYVQVDSFGVPMTPVNYLGPAIVAQANRPVRIKFVNKLPANGAGNLFLPVDTTIMGAGMGPHGGNYSENRATLHLHGGVTPWISDGTPHQWTTPAGEITTYPVGVSVKNVPDMDAGQEPSGTLTFYYSNQQSARLMFYHDHSYGITRLNVYAGEAAPYLLNDPVEQKLVNGGQFKNAAGTTVTVAPSTVPTEQIPLVIQDRTFVPTDTQLAQQDPTWDKARWGGLGSLWFPHVYMPNQNPGDAGGVNAVGRWDYSFWMYPPLQGVTNGPVPNPLAGQPGEYAFNPGTPLPTAVPEAFMDTPLVNGTAYPYLKVERKAYRFRVLNACNDRNLNLQLYFAKSNTPDSVDSSGNPTLQTASGDVSMTVAAPHPGDPNWPATWPTDGRDGGVPDPSVVGPSMIQIGNEGGLLPSAAVLPNNPVNYEYFRRTILFANVTAKTLFLGPAERADIIVDFSQVPAGSKLILYNDAPAAVPGFDSRYDYYTDDPDQTSSGGAPTTKAGYGPNTRTMMQFDVGSAPAASKFDTATLQTALHAAYGATQPKPIVPEPEYNSAFATSYPSTLASILDTNLVFTPPGQNATQTMAYQNKAILEGFDMDYGRMNALLGSGLPNIGFGGGAANAYGYVDPPTDVLNGSIPGTQIGTLADGTQIWQIEHQGVDTHSIHFHLFNVQVIERIAIDGQVLKPDANELGWKETVRMNPGSITILAVRPIIPVNLPWKLPDSVRPMNPAIPVGATFTDANGAPVVNTVTNFGWEYVWHCHLLGHEENDMMRPMVIQVAPAAPTAASATPSALSTLVPKITVKWTNNWTIPAATMVTLQRSTNSAFSSGVTSFTLSASAVTYTDTTVAPKTKYYYRVRAENTPAYSPWTNVVSATSPGQLPNAPTNLHVSAFSSTTITAAWTLPSGGAARTSVKIQWRVNNTGSWASRTLSSTAVSYQITGLHKGTKYQIRVYSVNGSGSTVSATITKLL
jgi:FtsP/CotA-like multicopper oxidase with cupredoxin domain